MTQWTSGCLSVILDDPLAMMQPVSASRRQLGADCLAHGIRVSY
jgi:hypothetical protein